MTQEVKSYETKNCQNLGFQIINVIFHKNSKICKNVKKKILVRLHLPIG
jgi:hypothetical protein